MKTKLTPALVAFYLVILFICTNSFAQETVTQSDDLYGEEKLVYKTSDKTLFTGVFENRRKNGRLVCTSVYDNGIIQECKHYHKDDENIVSDITIYNKNKPTKRKEYYVFNLESELTEKEIYNNDGKLILIEKYENQSLVYSCEYDGIRKNGKEYRYYPGTNKVLVAYYNGGKKIKDLDNNSAVALNN